MGDRVQKFKVLTAEGAKLEFNRIPTGDLGVGFCATDVFEYTIPNGETGLNNSPILLDANYKIVGVMCESCVGIPAATNMRAEVSFIEGAVLCTLYEQDDPGTLWSQGPLPQSGTLAFVLTHTFGVRKLRLYLTNPTTGDVTFLIFGFDSGS